MQGSLRAVSVVAGALAAMAVVPSAGAQSSCVPASRALSADATRSGAPLLEKRISVRAKSVTLREALDKVAAAADIRFSYSTETLPLGRPACLDYQSVSVARILSDLFEGVAVRAVAVSADQVALTPVQDEKPAPRSAESTPVMKQVGLLERVVITGVASDDVQRANPVAVSVVSRENVMARGSASLSATLDGAVPGLWMWEQSPLNMLARYGSIRGASSFGVSYPKVYVDGIEVANSLLVTSIDPEAIARVEIIRGPQGAALYGADAISGVMNIVTFQQGTDNGAPRAQIRTQGGTSASDYSAASVFTQNHAASLQVGTNGRSARLGASATRMGAFIPDAFSEHLSANGSVRFIKSRSVFTGTMRFFAQNARTPTSPIVRDFEAPLAGAAFSTSPLSLSDSNGTQAVRQFTLGGSASFAQSARWTHSLTTGLDGYSLRGVVAPDGGFTTPADSALRAAAGGAVRATVKTASVGRFGNEASTAATVTVSAEHSMVRDRTTSQAGFGASQTHAASGPVSITELRSNTGVTGQVSAGFRDAVFVSGGVRIERNSGPAGVGDLATLPMIGVSAVHAFGPATFKVRSAFGRGIRPVQNASRVGMLMGYGGSLLGTPLEPEQQSGTEFGADAFIGARISFHVTRFDQRASGLVQPVGVAARVQTDSGPRFRHIGYELQNVGGITNRGWELQGAVTEGPWSLATTFSQVDSRVARLGMHYTGDLRTGDRMLEVPSHTFGLNAGYAKGRWSASWAVSRASDWINYDRIALLEALSNDGTSEKPLVGSELRSFWTSYDGVTRMSARLGVNLARGMLFNLNAENLLDQQRGEPDNITVLPGRTLSAGLRLSF
jgi:iron complex outermembrane receptor protein